MRRPRSLFDPSDRQRIVARLRSLEPGATRRWGSMTAPRMICHLADQVRHALGLSPVEARRGWLRWGCVKWLTIYVLPWPKGKVEGPPEAFLTQPASWKADLAEVIDLVDQLAARNPGGDWPDHALMGRMSGGDWGVFTYKHFDHHLRQFGA